MFTKLLATLAAGGSVLNAADVTWSGTNSGTWDTSTLNWDSGVSAFTDGDNAIFSGTPTNNVTAAAGLIIGSINLQSGFTGTVTLTGANSVNGATTVSGGTLSIGNSSALGTSQVTLAGGTFNFSGGSFTLANNVNVTGATNIATASGSNQVISGNWSGSGNLTLVANGTTAQWGFGGDNSGYSGTFTQNGGNTSLRFDSVNSGSAAAAWVFNNSTAERTRFNFGTGTIKFGSLAGSGALANIGTSGSVATVEVGALNTSTTFSGTLKNGGTGGISALTKVGTGELTLTGGSTFTGGTIVNGGTLTLAKGGATGAILGTLTVNAGATVKTTVTDALGFNSNGTQITQINLIGGTFNNAAVGNQGFTTNFALTGGTVTSTGGGSINFTTGFGITSNAGSTTSTFIAPITLRTGNNMAISVASGTTASGVDLEISGTIAESQGTGAITKTGAGKLVFSGANTYTGATTVNAGTLALGAADRISDSSALVLGGGTFATGGFSETLNTLTVSADSTIDFGSGASALSFSDSSSISWTGIVTLLNFNIGTDTLRFGTSDTALTSDQLSRISLAGYEASLDASGFVTFSAIPEPSAYAAVFGVLALAGAASRRRR